MEGQAVHASYWRIFLKTENENCAASGASEGKRVEGELKPVHV